MFTGHKFYDSGNITFSNCHITSCYYLIRASRGFKDGSLSMHVSTFPSLVSMDLLQVDIYTPGSYDFS